MCLYLSARGRSVEVGRLCLGGVWSLDEQYKSAHTCVSYVWGPVWGTIDPSEEHSRHHSAAPG